MLRHRDRRSPNHTTPGAESTRDTDREAISTLEFVALGRGTGVASTSAERLMPIPFVGLTSRVGSIKRAVCAPFAQADLPNRSPDWQVGSAGGEAVVAGGPAGRRARVWR